MIRQGGSGFSLIELILVIVIVGIMATMTTSIIVKPVESYIDLERRTRLVDTSEMAIRRMQRDIRQALPSSIRTTTTATTAVIEMLHIVDGGRYRHKTSSDVNISCSVSGDNVFLFGLPDRCFDVLGQLENFSTINLSSDWLIFPGANAYNTSNRVLLSSSTTSSKIHFSSINVPLSLDTPPYRFFIVDTPITYRCDLSNQQLVRYEGYSIASSQPNPPTGGTNSLQANKISSCVFSYNAVSAIVSLNITVTDNANESIALTYQVHVDNLL